MGDLVAGRPPVLLLLIAALAALVATLVAGLFGEVIAVAVPSWFVGGPVAVGILALFTTRDTTARTAPLYMRPTWVRGAYTACLILCALAVVVSSLRIAFYVGSR